MAGSQTVLFGAMLPGQEDFGFDGPVADEDLLEMNADFGFDGPVADEDLLDMDAIVPCGNEDFGFDGPVPDGELLGMDALLAEDERIADQGGDNIPMDTPPAPEAQNLSTGREWIWGNRATPQVMAETSSAAGTSNSAVITEGAQSSQEQMEERAKEYRRMASMLIVEAKKIRELYSDLQKLGHVDSELTSKVNEIARELRLD